MDLAAFFDERTSTLTYVVWDAKTRDAIVIDPVMDYEPAGSGGIRYLKIPLNVFEPKQVSEVRRLGSCEAVQPTGAQG